MKVFQLTLIGSFICFQSLFAQKFSGIATYQYSTKMQIYLDSTQMSPDQIKKIKDQIQNQANKEFTLAFTATESTWDQVESLEKAPAASSGSNVNVNIGGPAHQTLYKNIPEKRYERAEDLAGKEYIIKDNLTLYDWKLTEDFKQIGSHKCQKAVYERVVEMKVFSSNVEEMEVKQDTIVIEAWFATDIPVNHGPEMFYGLPGLILELRSGGSSYVCSKVVLNPEDAVEIDHPKKGKVISAVDFEKVRDEKMEEMQKRYNGSVGDGKQIQIRVGG